MNPENNMGNNLDNNSMNSSSLGAMPSPETLGNAQPNLNNVESQTLNDLSALGVQSLQSNVGGTTQPSSLEGVTLNSAINNYQAPSEGVVPSNEAPVQAPIQTQTTLNDMISPVGPINQEVATLNPSFADAQVNQPVTAESTVASQTVPVMSQSEVSAPSFNEVQQSGLPQQEVVTPVNSPEMEAVQTAVQTGPTMPIPDSMPDLGYQAAVSTPVDYATPMSDFDQIGETPELDPKAKNKGNKKGGKTAVFVLILLLICALGGGAYYLINVKGILDKSSVKTKTLNIELGSTLSEDINDYATFSNTSSSNCVQDLSKVDTSKVGTYEFVIKCGKDEYKGKITVSDNTAPSVILRTKVYRASQDNVANPDDFIKSCSESDCSYTFADEADISSQLASKGVKTIKINVSDASGNNEDVTVPVIVVEEEFNVGLLATRSLVSNDEYAIKEKVVVLYSGNSYLTYTMYDFQFTDKTIYITNAKKSESSDELNIADYTGIPVYNDEDMRITLVSTEANNLVQGSYKDDREALLSVGYTPEVFSADYISLIDF